MPPKAAKIQRWFDLLAALLSRRFPATFDELARDVPEYSAQGKKRESVKRMFERDKDDLRSFGVPIEMVPMSDGDESGYRLRPRDFYLPYLAVAASRPGSRASGTSAGYSAMSPLSFEPDELAAIGDAAARARSLGDPLLAADAECAMRKLAFDLPVDATRTTGGEPLVATSSHADAEVFAALGEALLDRKLVTFDYHKMGDDSVTKREVEPYGLFFLNGHWYLAARDTVHGQVRNFRVSRMSAARKNVKAEQTPDFEVPSSFRLRDHAKSRQAWELGDEDSIDAVVEFRGESGAVRSAARLGEPVQGEPGRRRFMVRRADPFVRWLLSFAGDAVPLSPPALVEQYRGVLKETLEIYAGGAS